MRGVHMAILVSLLVYGASRAAMAQDGAERLIDAARGQIGVTLAYDPRYVRIAFPGGDIPLSRGVCSDVVIRAFRQQGLDLQVMVHDDMAAHFSAYPANWGLKHPDPNIDHRRVPNLATWLKRQGKAVAISRRSEDYAAGDIVTWRLPGGQPHIGIVSDRRDLQTGNPLIIHNIGRGTQEEDILFAYDITGHFRYFR